MPHPSQFCVKRCQSMKHADPIQATLDTPIEAPGGIDPTEFVRQLELEAEMLGLGRQRYERSYERRSEKRAGSTTSTGKRLVKVLLDPVAAALTEFIQEVYSGRPGPKAVAAKLLRNIPADVVAYLAGRETVNLLMLPRGKQRLTLHEAANAIARAVEAEARFRKFEEENPGIFRWVTEKLDADGATEQQRRSVLIYQMGRHDIEWDAWGLAERLQVGSKLLDLLSAHTGLIELRRNTSSGITKGRSKLQKTPWEVTFAAEAEEWIAASYEGGLFATPALMPTIVPPKPWTGLSGGGYYGAGMPPLSLVSRTHAGQGQRLRAADLSRVLEGVNAIQATPWAINRVVLAVMRELSESDAEHAGLPRARDLPLPAKPADIDTNEEARKAWRAEARDIHNDNHNMRAKKFRLEGILAQAERFAEEDGPIYFPHTLDFRGRAYPVPSVLQPQGDDRAKAVLRFWRGKPLGGRGAHWLAIHGANCFGVDKVGFDERVAWVHDNEAAIREVAEDPFGNLWWADADSPWQFLAFCLEWRDVSGMEDPSTYISHLPIALDGSCNGLQHFSAMLRDPVGGEAVNLVPAEAPQDIYARVAARAEERLRAIRDAGPDDDEDRRPDWAEAWLTLGVDRKIAKRPVMVLPYGGTIRSCVRYVREAVVEKAGSEEEANLGDEFPRAVGFLASVVWESIGDVVVAAKDAMSWLQQSARAMTKVGAGVTWTTPSGFVAGQSYPQLRDRVVKTKISGAVVKLVTKEETGVLDANRQASGMSPNYVHSMDAAAMLLTVVRLRDAGLDSFAMIHDSYGVHAADTDLLAVTLREVFVGMYSGDPLGDLRAEMLETAGAENVPKLRPVPPRGELDVSLVSSSPFFFA